jgi:hypothetical protein
MKLYRLYAGFKARALVFCVLKSRLEHTREFLLIISNNLALIKLSVNCEQNPKVLLFSIF